MTALFSVKKTLFFLFFYFISICVYAQTVVETNNIPHIIHYVWFGKDDPPQNVKNALATWQKNMPDWQIKRWNEENCDVNNNDFVRYHFENKYYDFASDYCRVYALETEGGVYFDTDTILNKSIEPYLSEPLVLAKENATSLSSSSVASIPHHPFFKKVLEKYQNNEAFNYQSAPQLFTDIFTKMYQPNLDAIQKKGEYAVYEANILILDFNGPENAASHLYAQGSGNTATCGYYCRLYKEYFLNDHAYHLIDKDQYVLPIDQNQCYLVHKTNDEWLSTTPRKSAFCSFDKDVIAYTTQDNEIFVYPCFDKIGCTSLENTPKIKSYYCYNFGWEDKLTTYNNRVYRANATDQATVLEQSDTKLCVKWDYYGKECFVWDSQRNGYVISGE